MNWFPVVWFISSSNGDESCKAKLATEAKACNESPLEELMRLLTQANRHIQSKPRFSQKSLIIPNEVNKVRKNR